MHHAIAVLCYCPAPVNILLYSHSWCRSPPTLLFHKFRHDLLQCLGYRWTGKVRWSSWWILHPGPVRHYHVRRHLQNHLQERPQLAPRSWACLREHSHCTVWKQGWRQGRSGLLFYRQLFDSIVQSRSAKWRQALSRLTAKRTFLISKSPPNLTTISRSHSCGLQGSWLGTYIFHEKRLDLVDNLAQQPWPGFRGGSCSCPCWDSRRPWVDETIWGGAEEGLSISFGPSVASLNCTSYQAEAVPLPEEEDDL